MDSTDILIIGGGINGCGVAADAAGRGLNVTLCEMQDLASATSSWSSKLIHGGLRYLESYDFKLVREALQEREVLLEKAPFLIHPLEFILPHEKHLRPTWMIRIGLFLYDHLAKRKQIPGSKHFKLEDTKPKNPLKPEFQTGFSYFDCQTDDARLTVLNAIEAAQQGANILTRTQCVALKPEKTHWVATLKNTLDGHEEQIQAKIVVNAAGPWVDQVSALAHVNHQSQIRLVQGSHIVVPKLYDGDHAYILQNTDQRIVFTIPYLDDFTLIGTTDVNYTGDPAKVAICEDEKHYLCEIINTHFQQQISASDIVWAYSGVRPLYDNHADNASKTTRDFHLELTHDPEQPPYIAIYGGKITTYRVLAEALMEKLKPFIPDLAPAWTGEYALPGGDLELPWDAFLESLYKQYHWLPKSQVKRYASAYGTNIHALLKLTNTVEDLGIHYGADLYECEVKYWIANEWAQTAEDMLWRRSKLGLRLTPDEQQQLKDYLDHV